MMEIKLAHRTKEKYTEKAHHHKNIWKFSLNILSHFFIYRPEVYLSYNELPFEHCSLLNKTGATVKKLKNSIQKSFHSNVKQIFANLQKRSREKKKSIHYCYMDLVSGGIIAQSTAQILH